jgi:hypothetical protein
MPPPGVTVRASGTQSGSGRVTGLLVDSGAAPIGPYSAGSATAAASSSFATMWTIVLAPPDRYRPSPTFAKTGIVAILPKAGA